MKRAMCFLLTAAMIFSMSACGSSNSSSEESSSTAVSDEKETEMDSTETEAGMTAAETEETETESEIVVETSLLSVVGVYYGDLYVNQKSNYYEKQQLEGFKDCIVVFDYTNDATNRRLPESQLQTGYLYFSNFTSPEVTILVNNTNVYEAYDPVAYDSHYSNAISRYTSYANPIGYGNMFGGAEPVRMFSVFYVNPNELNADSTAILTVGDQEVEFSFENIVEISYPDEILMSEDEYESLQQVAAFKWRMDKVCELVQEVDHSMASMNPGSDLSGVGSSIGSIFSSEYGVTISGLLAAGFSSDHIYDGMNKNLPAFDIDVLTTLYPEQAENITSFVDATNLLGKAVQSTSYSKSDIESMLEGILETYFNLLSAFDMEPIED